VDHAGPIEQADVVASLDNPDVLAAVVTADCDIFQRKAWGKLQIIPLVPALSYVASRLVVDDIEARILRHRSDILVEAERCANEASVGFTQSSVADAIGAGDAEGLADYCRAPERVAARWKATLTAIGSAESELRSCPPRNACWGDESIKGIFALLRDLCTRTNSQPPDRKKFVSQLNTPRDDIFLLPDTGEDRLLVAILRFVDSIPNGEVASQVGSARKTAARRYRIARILPPYRYEMTRKLGNVFSGIGLPSTYEQSRDRKIDRIRDLIGEFV